ncbi:PaaI family thioesterase [Pseudooceanicola sediminis]|uniref:PaaI family thioesterase n=1 Tax=Pseudooceanicola sediminis TaxID=2211117 RepID=A0A399J5M3_9RHOB|nr:PaaI family thioesterase [Pseudooceanicola sediminis]KAA2316885.1 PaaI family thioesterase [Puniceibacterium sp. HSS470]RII40661.1 PaaI family thioesterase [Pseudooceanicola sediminis]|tara:strand:- start:115195 stop:115611 length:417 start_codon:yes stop_codon:yes gene_type:complete
MAVKMDAEALSAFLVEVFPQVHADFVIEDVQDMALRVRLKVAERHLRPGGTVSGPSMFALADVAVYLAVLAMIGPKALTVTTSCSMDFMRKPRANADLIGRCTLLKLGRSLAVGDVLLFSEGAEAPVARATMTYAIPS